MLARDLAMPDCQHCPSLSIGRWVAGAIIAWAAVFSPSIFAGTPDSIFSHGFGQVSPIYCAPQPGFNAGTQSAAPADWLTANGGVLPNAPGCPSAISASALDPVMLTRRVRVPDNASLFNLRASFLSSEYPGYVCSPFNDVFFALLDSSSGGAPANPKDKNLATYRTSTGLSHPVATSLAYGSTGLFNQCINGPTVCAGGIAGATTSCNGITGILGTGTDNADPGNCSANSRIGGATANLVISGNVEPGEVVTLRLALWDATDGTFDSIVLFDAFRWSRTLTIPGANLD